MMTTRMNQCARALAAGAILALTGANALHAQVASPSTRALGMGDNFTAAARGFSAVAWNPGNLGLTGNPGFSLTLGTVRGVVGLDPVTVGDLAEWQDELVPNNVKQEWLNAIQSEGSQAGTGGTDVTWLALQAGPFAVQASSSAVLVSNLSPGIAELVLFGNADDQGAKNIDLSGSTMDINAFTTVAASYGMGFTMSSGARLGVGVTGKYTVGHFLARSQESQGAATASPIGVNLTFPTIHSAFGDDPSDGDEFDPNGGSGIGLDVGVGYEKNTWTFGATVQNIVNTFEWDETMLRYRANTFVVDEDTDASSNFDSQPIGNAPAALREAIEDMKFKPSVALGASNRMSDKLMIAADARFGGTASMQTRPQTQVGAGVEYRLIDALPVRAGAAFVKLDDENSGYQIGGGVGLELGFFNLSASLLRRSTDLGADNMFMFTVLSWGR